MASSLAGSTEVFERRVLPAGVGRLGRIAHLQHLIGLVTTLEAEELVWLTDTTPHCTLLVTTPGKRGAYQQFFRLVTSFVSVGYQDHSTENTLMPRPVLGSPRF